MINNADFNIKQGSLLKTARKMANMSQTEVGTHFSVSQDTISKMERGQTNIPSHAILKFSRLYGKPITYFYMTD